MTTFLSQITYSCFIIFIISLVLTCLLRIFKVKVDLFNVIFVISLVILIPSSIFALICYIDFIINGGWSIIVVTGVFLFIILPSILLFCISLIIYYFYKRKVKDPIKN